MGRSFTRMKKKPVLLRSAEDAKAAAKKNWERQVESVERGQVDREALVQAMEWQNKLAAEEEAKRLSDYMQFRETCFVDPDESCGDAEADAHYDSLRRQFQLRFGKDVKHG